MIGYCVILTLHPKDAARWRLGLKFQENHILDNTINERINQIKFKKELKKVRYSINAENRKEKYVDCVRKHFVGRA